MSMVDALAGKLADCQEKLSITIRNNVSAAMEIAASAATIATLTAALEEARGALEAFEKMAKSIEADVLTAHNNRGAGASGWMREDDADMRADMRGAFDRARTALTTINAALGRVEG